MISTLLSWGGCVLLLIGLKLIGDKNIKGFHIALIAESLWIVWGVLTGTWALVVMSLAISAMYARSIYQWQKPVLQQEIK